MSIFSTRAVKIMEFYRKNLDLDNNEAWIEEHKLNLFPFDYEKTSNYVNRHHPHRGSAHNIKEWKGDEELEVLASKANVVTRVCYELIGNQALKRADPNEWKVTNDMVFDPEEIANKAYIALHHDGYVKSLYYAYILDWKELRREK